uniref:Putative secreted protein n=1 Tax=Ixodes ricinus TaxID=34613 RepID=A0A6B0U000_IXORI
MVPGLSVLMATGVVLFQRPSQTSPNWPWPSLRTNLSELRSISHWSRVLCDSPLVMGFSTCTHGLRRLTQSPSASLP